MTRCKCGPNVSGKSAITPPTRVYVVVRRAPHTVSMSFQISSRALIK